MSSKIFFYIADNMEYSKKIGNPIKNIAYIIGVYPNSWIEEFVQEIVDRK